MGHPRTSTNNLLASHNLPTSDTNHLPPPPNQAPLYFPDGGARWLDAFAASGEPVLPLTQHALDFPTYHTTGPRDPRTPLTISDNWALNDAREAYRREHHALMRARGVDVLLCPAYPAACARQAAARYWLYSAVWNILDLPAAVLPSGLRCDRDVDVVEEGYVPRGPRDEEVWKDCEFCFSFFLVFLFSCYFAFSLPLITKAARCRYQRHAWLMNMADDPELFHGFPVALQVVGKRFRDEDVLAAAKVLDAALKSS